MTWALVSTWRFGLSIADFRKVEAGSDRTPLFMNTDIGLKPATMFVRFIKVFKFK